MKVGILWICIEVENIISSEFWHYYPAYNLSIFQYYFN